jgi:hypothetical protein
MTTRPLNPDAALPVGIEIGGHAVEAVVAVGDTGFVYVASDPLLARQVAIKEYFPPGLAVRHAGTQMRARSASDHRLVMDGRDAFVEESRLLARIDHPALVRVIGAHEAHQTAYRVMPFHAGPTLAQARMERGVPPGDDWLLRMIGDLLGALEAVHAAGIVHGHLHPSQVLLKSDDRPLLLGFGSAARVLHRGIDAEYLPPELAPAGHKMQRGPWTDLHALALLGWFTVMGTAPSSARKVGLRVAFDAAFGPPEGDAQTARRDRLCAALTRAMAEQPADRPQSVDEMRALLGEAPAEEADAQAKEPELPPEPDPRVRAAIAAAVASIPDIAPRTVDGGGPAAGAHGTKAQAKSPVPMAGLAPAFEENIRPSASEPQRAATPRPAASSPTAAPAVAPVFPASPTRSTAPATAQAAPVVPPPVSARMSPAEPLARASAAPPRPHEPARAPFRASMPTASRAGAAEVETPAFEPTIPAAHAEPSFGVPRFDLPRADGARQEPAFATTTRVAPMPPLPEEAGTSAPERRAPERSFPDRAPAAGTHATHGAATSTAGWGRPASGSAGATVPTRAERDVSPFDADHEFIAEPRAAAARDRPRRTGWAWAAAVLVGVATGVVGWQWSEMRMKDTERVAVIPGTTQRPVLGGEPARTPPPQDAARTGDAATPPVAADPARADPTAAGRPSVATAPPPAQAPATDADIKAATAAVPATPPPAGTATSDERVAAVAPPTPTAPPVAEETVADRARAANAREPSARAVPRPAPRPTVPQPPRRTAAIPAPTPLPSPRATCGDRSNFSLVYCMQQQCRRPAYSAHPQCREFRRTGEVN